MVSIALSDLVTRLQANVPAYDRSPADDPGTVYVPSAAQYEQAVKDAVGTLSNEAPILREAEIETVSGQASYDLPDDFMRLVSFTTYATDAGGVIVTHAGIIPAGRSAYEETITIAGATLTINPTPGFNDDRTLRYAAKHVLNEATDTYETLTDEAARVVMLEAESIALGWVANAVTAEAWTYSLAEERVDKTKLAEQFRTQAEVKHAAFKDAVKRLAGGAALGMRSKVTAGDLAYLEKI